MPDSGGRKRIAILGGGAAAMTAAYELTEVPDWQDKYEITVYQMGWRLGGKGASGRNRKMHDRIEEHGLHIWFGYYENAFNLMQRCYAALGRSPGQPLAKWDDAFHKHSLFVISEFYRSQWTEWRLYPPEIPGEVPGDGKVPPLWELLDRLLGLMHRHFETTSPDDVRAAVAAGGEHPGWLARLVDLVRSEVGHLASGLHGLNVARALAQRFSRGEAAVSPDASPQAVADGFGHFLGRVRDAIATKIGGVIDHEIYAHPELRRLLSLLELGHVILKGIIADDVINKGFDHLDKVDLRQWMASHGGGRLAMDADLLRVAYESIFAYEHGSYARPNLAAGTGLRGILRLSFAYKGAFAWKMQAGMGDTVFAPLYLVLRQRGVHFQFFSRVNELVPSADGTRIERIDIGRQATVLGDSYEPLYPVQDLLCWPSEPFYEQLKEGHELEHQQIDLESNWSGWPDVAVDHLVAGTDFDEVILGISIGALPAICPKLIALREDWQLMVKHVQAIYTQAFQIWTTPDIVQLGWGERHGDRIVSPVFGGYAQPHNTCADMSQLIVRESWPPDARPGAIFYFCGPHGSQSPSPPPVDLDFPIREEAAARVCAAQWLRTNMEFLMPNSISRGYPASFPDTFDFGILHDVSDPSAPESSRFRAQFWRSNVDPSDRYVLSLAGSTEHRLRPGASGFTNLKLAGDWTYNGLNYGCVEAAVMSGMDASRAISGYPKVIFGENFPKA